MQESLQCSDTCGRRKTSVSSSAGWDRPAAGRVVKTLRLGVQAMIWGQSRSSLQGSFQGETCSLVGNVDLRLRGLGKVGELGFRVTSI